MRLAPSLAVLLAAACGHGPGPVTATVAPEPDPEPAAPPDAAGEAAEVPAPPALEPPGVWLTEDLSPPGGGPFDYPSIAVRGDEVAVLLGELGGSGAFLGQRRGSGWSWEAADLGVLGWSDLRFAERGLEASVRTIDAFGPSVEVSLARWGAGGLRVERRATGCRLGSGASLLVGSAAGLLHVFACGEATTVLSEPAAGGEPETLARLAGLSVRDAALGPDRRLHLVAHVLGTSRSDLVVLTPRPGGPPLVERAPIEGSGIQACVRVRPDGTRLVLFDRVDRELLERELRAAREVVLRIERPSGPPTERRVGEGAASRLALDSSGRAVVLSASSLAEAEPTVFLERGTGWLALPLLAEPAPDLTVHDATVDPWDRLHVVYSWTSSHRGVRYARLRLPE